MKTLKWIFSYIRPYLGRTIFALCLTMINTVLSNVRPYLTGRIVDEVFYDGMRDRLMILVVLIFLSIVLKDIFRIIDHYILEGTSQRIVYNIRVELYKSLQKLDFPFFDHNRTGDIMNRMSGDIDSVRHFVAWVVNGILENVCLFFSALIILFFTNWKLTLCLLAVTPIIAFVARSMGTKVGPAFRNARQRLSMLNTVVQENISGNRVVKAFAREKYEMQKFDAANLEYRDANLKSNRIWQNHIPYLDTLANSLNVIVLVVGGFLVVRGDMTPGEFVTFNSMSWALNTPMRNVGWLINDSQNAMASGEKIMEFTLEKPVIHTEKGYTEKDRFDGRVDFDHVSFSYGEEEVLRDVSFTAVPGQTVAIIGETGSGKSTLTNLICRFYDATSGSVKVDGVDVRHLNLRRLRQSISIAMQDIFLFSDTIEGNIAYGVPDAPMEEIVEAAKMADADGFIRSMPDGYDTIIGERGVGLSGGQKQRIALARAILKNPSILILDDTTSSVDMETEHYIQRTLKEFSQSRTTFIIAHRISAVKDADLILVMEDGRIAERGTHEELLRLGGRYKEVYDTQYGSFDAIGAKGGVLNG
ncbi:MAG: ABC transporter ATP-binding protein [Oscillospiraceae bacterium]|nr:ABC transporter ATP-binding protein [Oscillospiraceae bacterium]